MDHFAQRPQRRRQQAFSRLHRRQSRLAEPRDVPQARGGDALGREHQAGTGVELLQRLAAAVGHGPPVLARALIAQGDIEAAKPLIREAWRDHSLSAEVEKQVLERYSEFLTRADHKARMEKRVIAADNEAALRVARRLGAADLAIAQARIAINPKGADVKKLLDAVPADAPHDT